MESPDIYSLILCLKDIKSLEAIIYYTLHVNITISVTSVPSTHSLLNLLQLLSLLHHHQIFTHRHNNLIQYKSINIHHRNAFPFHHIHSVPVHFIIGTGSTINASDNDTLLRMRQRPTLQLAATVIHIY